VVSIAAGHIGELGYPGHIGELGYPGHIGELGYLGHRGRQVVLLSASMSTSTFHKYSSCVTDVIFKVAIFMSKALFVDLYLF